MQLNRVKVIKIQDSDREELSTGHKHKRKLGNKSKSVFVFRFVPLEAKSCIQNSLQSELVS